MSRTITYDIGGHSVHVRADLTAGKGDFLTLHISSQDPDIAAVHFGGIGPAAYRRAVAVPYYGVIQYLPDAGLFANLIVDHKLSLASRLDGDTAVYDALTDGSRNRLDETVYYALSPDLICVLPSPNNEPSPYRAELANRVVLDSWGGVFADNAAFLKLLATYRITNLLTIAHVWQNGRLR